ncbi:MAG: 5-formyltetrahydrofolate cyclo-ligase [Rhodobiaceae bacterium]|nr:5-formyltetrahydrofolate cyclo-ligase [Rhodobiaceae bacterium]
MPGPDKAADIAAAKASLRARVLARRDAKPAHQRAPAENAIRALLLTEVLPLDGVVSGFLPIRSEVDITPVLVDLVKAGRTVVLPVVIDRETVEFREWTPDTPLEDAGFGTRGPGEDAEVIDPDIVIAPLAAFDRRGIRLGYGAGHYDRALARLDAAGPVTTIGVAFALQQEGLVPAERTDRPLDRIVTEHGVLVADRTP